MEIICLKILELMLKTQPNGFPVFAAIIRNGVVKELVWNKRAKKNNGKHKHENHAEWLLKCHKLIENGDELVISFPPCKDCLMALEQLNIKKIYCLFDPYRKLKNESWVTSKIEFIPATGREWTAVISKSKKLIKARYFLDSHKDARIQLMKINGSMKNIFSWPPSVWTTQQQDTA